ncbi:hypothetical protein [Rhodococcus sp. NPDC058521]
MQVVEGTDPRLEPVSHGYLSDDNWDANFDNGLNFILDGLEVHISANHRA